MSRELNSHLFEEDRENHNKSLSHIPQETSDLGRNGLIGELVGQIRQLKAALKSVEARTTQSENRISSLFSSALSLSERQQKQAQGLEASMKSTIQSMNTKMSQLASRIMHKNAKETQIKELLDRHNEIVNNFESRLEKMQRKLSQQEMQLMSYRSVVNELIDRTSR